MVRVPIRRSIMSPVNGSALVGVEATITKHVAGSALGSGEAAKIYLSETEGTQVSGNTILSDEKGGFTQGEAASWAAYWLPVGAYDFYFHGKGTDAIYQVVEMVSGAAEAVMAEQLAEGAVTEAKIGAEAVSEGKIKNEGVATAKIKALAVTAAKLAASAVEAAKIAAGAVTTEKLASEAVTGAKLGEGTVRLLAEAKYGTLTGRTSGAEYEANASRPTAVTVQYAGAGEDLTVTVGGVVIVNLSQVAGGIGAGAISFVCAAGVKWHLTSTGATIKSSYLTL